MSWISKNYEKATLGGAAVVALGLIFLGWSKFGAVEEDFGPVLKGTGSTKTAVLGADQIPKSLQSLTADRSWKIGETSEGRAVDLFTGIALYVRKSDPNKPFDPVKGEEIHPPIPNIWWIENRIDPGFGDSPDRDPDGDGFSNMEEFLAKTDPNDEKKIPALIAKLRYVRDESLTWVLQPRYGSEGKFPFNYVDSNKDTNKVRAADMVAANELFFAKGVMANRFKLLGAEVRREMNTKVNVEMDVTYVRIEDQRPNKVGTIYEIPAPLSEQRMGEFKHYDRTAILTLEALGQEGTELKVEENTSFALPPGAAKKDYFVKKVTPESVTVEYPGAEGKTETVEIQKGSLPDLASDASE